MRIVVTGASGFLGSHIADALGAAGHETVIFDLARSRWLQSNQRMFIGSVLDPEAVERALCDCDVVYPLAAMADISETLERPRDAVELNIMGTVNVLEAARTHHVGRFVFASSIYVYS